MISVFVWLQKYDTHIMSEPDGRDAKIAELTAQLEQSSMKLAQWKEKVRAIGARDLATIQELQTALTKTETELHDRTARMETWKGKVKAITLMDQQRIQALEGWVEVTEGRRRIEGEEGIERHDMVVKAFEEKEKVRRGLVEYAVRLALRS